jgi:mono/diheme cytochrome c family protein
MRKTTIAIIAGATVLLGVAGARAQDANELWTKSCASCHGPDMKGDTKAGKAMGVKDLTTLKLDKAAAAKAIKEGVKRDDKQVMKAFGDKLSEAEIDALAGKVASGQ